MVEKELPILYYSGGWQTIGSAKSLKDATRKIRNQLSEASLRLLKVPGWTLRVQPRNSVSIDLNGGPQGYIWDIGATACH